MAIVTNAGKILTEGTLGLVVDTACCCSAASTCAGGDPEILVTVSGSSGTINWVGETWNLPGDSGVQKTVCPTTYVKSLTTYTSGFSTKYVSHNWSRPGLALRRKGASRTIPDATPVCSLVTGNLNNLFISPTGVGLKKDFVIWASGQPCTGPTPSTTKSTLNMILTVGNPTKSDYAITNAFFGSHVVAGITYAWARGNGW